MRSVDEAPELGFFIPPMPQGGQHHVISRGQSPRFYRPEDMRDKGPGRTAWVDAFEELLVGLFLVLGGPVPYAFRTPDGRVRSLDAGCMKMLANRAPSDVAFQLDQAGYIDSVTPSDRLLELYRDISEPLVRRIRDATSDD